MSPASALTGRCYCGASTFSATTPPEHVAICHCVDCRRITGAAVPAFAAFGPDQMTITPDPGPGIEATPGVRRCFCQTCGSPLSATFDYLPDQVYVPIGILDSAETLNPDLHCHSADMLPWVETMNGLPHHKKSARDCLHRDKEPT